MTPIDRAPSRLSAAIAVGAAVVAGGATGIYSVGAASINAVGVGLIIWGVLRACRGATTAGAAVLFGGALVAGVQGVPAGPLLVAVTAAVVAWDAAGTAISVGQQLGRAAVTTRVELAHAAASMSVGVVTASIGYGLFRAATGGQPVTALLFLVIAAVLLAWALTAD